MSLIKKILLKWSPSANKEYDILESWKNEYKNQIKSLEGFHNNNSMEEKYHSYKELDKEKAWAVVENKINSTPNRNPSVFGAKPWQWAAVFVFMVSSILLLQVMNNQNKKIEFLASTAKKNIVLEDKSTVTLDINSFLVQNDFRNTELNGRAFFEVSKNPSHPFIIKTANAEIKVLGTSFFVTANKEFTEITMVTGKLSVSSSFGNRILNKGERILIDNRQMKEKPSGDAFILDWRNNNLTFNNVELVDVLKEVAIFYNVDLVLPDVLPLTSCLIKTKFEKSNLENVLSELSLIARFSYTVKNKTVIIEKMKC
jgi:transmembrane sensor